MVGYLKKESQHKHLVLVNIKVWNMKAFSPLDVVSQRDVVISSVHLGDDNVRIRVQLTEKETKKWWKISWTKKKSLKLNDKIMWWNVQRIKTKQQLERRINDKLNQVLFKELQNHTVARDWSDTFLQQPIRSPIQKLIDVFEQRYLMIYGLNSSKIHWKFILSRWNACWDITRQLRRSMLGQIGRACGAYSAI